MPNEPAAKFDHLNMQVTEAIWNAEENDTPENWAKVEAAEQALVNFLPAGSTMHTIASRGVKTAHEKSAGRTGNPDER